MGLGVSLIVIAAGAILVWGVTEEPSGLDLNAIGAILIVIGIVGFILSLLLWRSWWGPGYFSRETYVEGDPDRPGWRRRRRTTHIENEPPPSGPPPP